MKTEEMLNEREKTHGDFAQFSELWSTLNRAIREHTEEHDLTRFYPARTSRHNTAIAMILNKISRIICGDPTYADHWDDIAGYAMLGKEKEDLPCDIVPCSDFLCDVCKREQYSEFFEDDGMIMCGDCFNMNRNA